MDQGSLRKKLNSQTRIKYIKKNVTSKIKEPNKFNKPFIISIVTLFAILILSSLLFFSDQFVGKAVGDSCSMGTCGVGESCVDLVCQSCVAPPSDLISWWPANSDANDVISNNDGVFFGTITAVGSDGKVGGTFSFDGDSYISVADDDSLDMPANQDFSIEFWAKINGNNKHFLNKGTPYATNALGYDFSKEGGMFVYARIDAEPDQMSTQVNNWAKAPDGTNFQDWHHYAITFDRSDSGKFYFDGILKRTFKIDEESGDLSNPANLIIGALNPTSNKMDGNIDELSIYKNILTQGEITNVYDAGLLGAGKCGLECGDGFRINTEDCDTNDLNDETCVSQGFDGGDLGCSNFCFFDTSSCTNDPVCSSNTLSECNDQTSCEALGVDGVWNMDSCIDANSLSTGGSCDVSAACISNDCSGGFCAADNSCLDDSGCSGTIPICSGSNQCIACSDNNQCESKDPMAPKCNPDTGECVGTCNDQVLNNDETDVDCGPGCPKCADGKICNNDGDCINSCENNECVDQSAPITTASSYTSLTSTGATLMVTTNEIATCKYSINSGDSYTNMGETFETTGSSTSHSQFLMGLTANTEFTYYVLCEDPSNNVQTTSVSITFTTLICTPGALSCKNDFQKQTCNDDGMTYGNFIGCFSSTPMCSDGVCVGCTTDNDCDNPTPTCSNNQCISSCTTDNDCSGTPATPYCKQATKCVECVSTSDCSDGKTCLSNLGNICQCGGTNSDACGSLCVNKKTDNNNCGSCGNVCTASETCSSSNCLLNAGEVCTQNSDCFSDTCTNGVCLASTCNDNDNDGFNGYDMTLCSTGTDCDDSKFNVNPNFNEICDGFDNDCNGNIDDGSNMCSGNNACTNGACQVLQTITAASVSEKISDILQEVGSYSGLSNMQKIILITVELNALFS